jgi:hypothetical protein
MLAARDSEKKSAIINQFAAISYQHQVDPQMITQGINEIIAGKETPTVEMVMQQIQQQIQQKQMAQEQAQTALDSRGASGQPQAQQPQLSPEDQAQQIVQQSGLPQI